MKKSETGAGIARENGSEPMAARCVTRAAQEESFSSDWKINQQRA